MKQWLNPSVLPVDVDKAGAAGRDGVGVVGAGLPRDRAVRGDLDELELDGLPGGDAGAQGPRRGGGREHTGDGRVPRRGPVAQLDRVARQEDVVARLRRAGVEDGEGDGDELRR